MKKPELLLPAGNLEKLKIAFTYGADACYIGCNIFGLRKFADNFSESEIQEAVDLANEQGKLVYLVLNGFAHNEDLEDLIPYFETVEKLHPHGLIISDMGVLTLAKQHTSIDLHASTQASITSAYDSHIWKSAGASRMILAREVTISECDTIHDQIDTELEVFVHGAQCASYSGKCVISNYISGRDSNRGGCVQSCRHLYDIKDPNTQETELTTHIMNAQDLMAIRLLPQLIHSQIASLKIEGRMKSNLYAANCAATYRAAIDHCVDCLETNKPFDPSPYENQLKLVSNRSFSTGGLEHRPDSIHYATSNCVKEIDFIGSLKARSETQVLLEVKVPFKVGDTLAKLNLDGNWTRFSIDTIQDFNGQDLSQAKPNTLVWISDPGETHPYQVFAKPIEEATLA